MEPNHPMFDELSLVQKVAFILLFFAARLWSRVGPKSREAFGIKRSLDGGFMASVPYESFIIDNGERSIKLSVEYLAEWEGEWDDAEG